MALSPADFYAYSNATGVPVPETAEERAVLAPAVLDFRRNQLKSQEQNSNNLFAIGASALAGAAALGAGIAARRFLRGQPKVPKAPTRSANAGVVQQDLENLQRAAGRASTAEASVPTSKVAQPGAPTPEERQRVYASVAAKPVEELPFVYRPKGDTTEEVLMTDPRTGEMFMAGRSPKSFAEQYVSLRPALTGQKTDLPIQRTPGTFKEFSQAAQNIATDPTDRLLAELKEMRTAQSQELQERMANAYSNRVDELLNTTLVDKQRQTSVSQQQQTASALDSGEDQISGRIKQRLQQNEDLDLSQVELLEEMSNRSYQQMMDQPEPIVQAASRLPDGVPVDQTQTTQSLTSQELADIAKSEMMTLRQDLQARGLRPGTQRFENALSQTWATKSIPSATPGTTRFRQLQEQGKIDISLPGVIRAAVEKIEELPEEEALASKFLRSVPNVGPEAKVTSTAAGTAIRGASPSLYEVPVKVEERQLYGTGDPLLFGVPEEMGPDIAGSARVAGAMSTDIPEEELSKQEIAYSFLNKPPTPELAGGAAGIGVYGLEPKYVPGAVSKTTGQYSAASEQEPTYTPGWLQRKQMRSGFESLTTPQLMAGAEKATGRVQQAFQNELQRRQTAKQSLAVSEMFRRARIEGRI